MNLYFAYGSNLKPARMRARVPSSVFVARARVPAGRLSLDKRGNDGSGKANLARTGGDGVWGVVYRIDGEHWERMDAAEPGYDRVPVDLVTEMGEALTAHTYVARILTDSPVPFDWYKRFLVEGAREHALPAQWIATLEELPEKPDPRNRGRRPDRGPI